MTYGTMVPAATYADGLAFPRPITDDDLADPQVYATRHDMAADLLEGRIAELGTYRGDFAAHLLDACDPTELHLYDRNIKRISTSIAHHPRVTLHQGDSSTELAKAPDAFFDAIYIDGDHSPAGVMRDTDVAKRKVRPGGIVQMNDYTLWSVIEQAPYGICHAVVDLLDDGFKLVGYAFQHQGYPDVALVAP